MNRLQPVDVDASQSTQAVIEWGRYCASDSADHALFAPLHYEAGYSYPLVVWLHGPRDNEHQLKRIMPNVSMRNFVAVAPRGTHALGLDPAKEGYAWGQGEEEISLAEHRAMAAIEAAQSKFNISAKRIFIAGFGCGGTMAFRVAMNSPEQFAGALSLGGAFPTGYRPLRNLNALRRLPLFLSSGTEAKRYSPEQVCNDLRLFHTAGLSVTLRQYPCGDELTTLMLSDMNRWIMEQFCGSAQPAGAKA